MLPFLPQLIGAGLGAGIGAFANKKNRAKGALQGASLGLLGGSMGMGLKGLASGKPIMNMTSASASAPASVPNGLSPDSPFGQFALGQLQGDAPPISGSGTIMAKASKGGLKKYLNKSNLAALIPLAGMAIGALNKPESPMPEQQLPPLFPNWTPAELSPITALNPAQPRPMAPPVMFGNQNGGYYGQ